MDGNLFGVYSLKPDQVQVVNPILIIAMIPLFEYVIYPLLAKLNLLKRPLQRITTGGILAAAAFIICAFFQLRIESELPPDLSANSTHLTIVNGLPTNITIEHIKLFENSKDSIDLEEYGMYKMDDVHWDQWGAKYEFGIQLKNNVQNFPKCVAATTFNAKFNETFTDGIILFITESICDTSDSFIEKYDFNDILKKPEDGGANIGLVFKIHNYNILESEGYFENKEFSSSFNPTDTQIRNETSVGFMSYEELDIHKGGHYELYLVKNNYSTGGENTTEIATDLSLQQGGSYLMLVYGDFNGVFFIISLFYLIQIF
jgi:solute carrier family 15 oligopeptide transporter 1